MIASREPGCVACCDEVGWVGAVGQGGVGGVEVVEGEQPVVAFGGDLSGEVGVGGHDRGASVLVELGDLGFGEAGAEWRDADVAAVAGQGDGDRVERSFDQDGGGVVGEFAGDVELVALGEQGCGGGVEVLRVRVRSSSLYSGLRRATKPSTWWSWTMGTTRRSRKRSMSRPVDAVVATPAVSISSSVTPCRRRWVTRPVQPSGA